MACGRWAVGGGRSVSRVGQGGCSVFGVVVPVVQTHGAATRPDLTPTCFGPPGTAGRDGTGRAGEHGKGSTVFP